MKKRIGTLRAAESISDLDVVFIALYNLLAEKLEQEPNKGIVITKGGRKCKWSEVMDLAHQLEDYFACRRVRSGCDVCELCTNWKSNSGAAPHIGVCKLKGNAPVHKFESCKKFVSREEASRWE